MKYWIGIILITNILTDTKFGLCAIILTFIPIMLWRLVYEFGRNCLRDRQSAAVALASLVQLHSCSYIKTIWRTFCLWPPLQVRIVCKHLVNRSDVCLYKQRGRPNCWARSNTRARLMNSFVYKSVRRTWRHRKLAKQLEKFSIEYVCCNFLFFLTIPIFIPFVWTKTCTIFGP